MQKIGQILSEIDNALGDKLAAMRELPGDQPVLFTLKQAAALLDDNFNVRADTTLSAWKPLEKSAFIPNPASQGGGQGQQQQQPQQDPNQDPSQQGGGQGGPPPEQAAQQEAEMAAQQQQQASQGADGRGASNATDLDKTTVTLSLRDVLDLVSNGKATQSALKIQDAINKQQMKAEQMQRQQAMKEQQAQQQAQMGQGGGMMDSGGIYGGGQQGGGQPQPQQGGQMMM